MSDPTPDNSAPTPPPGYGQQPSYPAAPNSAPPYGQPMAPQYGQPYEYAVQPRTNVLAIMSLIASILGAIWVLPVIGSVAGIIMGHIASKQIPQTGEGGKGLATAGTIVGYIGGGLAVLAILAIVAISVILPLIVMGGLATTGELYSS
jgi:hypothetical protein